MSDHVGLGPDGGNLLGFLASVGTLVVLSDVWPDREVRMAWTRRGAWRPTWRVRGETTEEEIVAALHAALMARTSAPEFLQLGSNTNVPPDEFAAFARSAATQATSQDRRWADYVVAFGCEATTLSDGKQIQDTALRTMSGAGHQDFLGFVRKLIASTTEAHIRSALFAPWAYEDDGPSMRWDPIDDRRYAYRADDPAKSKVHPIRTMRGANRLAIEALPMFPTVPRGRRLYTTGFLKGEWVIRWPLWEGFASTLAVRSLLSHPEVVEVVPSRESLRRLGIVEVYSSRRSTEGHFRTFAPAEPLFGRAGS